MPFCHSTEPGEAGFGYIEDNDKTMLDNRPNFRPIVSYRVYRMPPEDIRGDIVNVRQNDIDS
jgi:hypothetical protein